MINTKLEELVETALDSLSLVNNSHETAEYFELEFRRALMKKYCNTAEVTKAPNSHTYTINGGAVMGTWATNTTKQQLNG